MEKKQAKSHKKVEMRKMNNEEDRLVSFSKRRSIERQVSFLPFAVQKLGKEKEVQSKGQSLLKGKSPVGKNVAVTSPSKKPTEENMKGKGKEPETEMTPEEAIKKAQRDKKKKDKEIEKV
ncbi:uncharacterized protein LOC117908294 [Vitis riparia]|uniref:uncharacterized protein LOC117908294 n=1 Tax=Vitis riparia TaxID=96939 RepID=UPI00155A87BA|nr:uncharacterized protein LOC117908294 [Vitis riparia]